MKRSPALYRLLIVCTLLLAVGYAQPGEAASSLVLPFSQLGYGDRTATTIFGSLEYYFPVPQDWLLQEGAARDVGHVARENDHPKILQSLKKLLSSADVSVRRGAIEGLGEIGTTECVKVLEAALVAEKDTITTGYIEESLKLCAGKDHGKAADDSVDPTINTIEMKFV